MVVADEGRRKWSNRSSDGGYKTEDEREREREFRCEMGEERLEMDRRERRRNTVILVVAFLAGSTRGGRLKNDSD